MASFIGISEAASLAIHSMALIAVSEERLNAGQIAKTTGASRNHLAKVLQRLVKYGFLDSNRGPKGGFVLKRDASKINLLQIYQLIEGEIEEKYCSIKNMPCPFTECIYGSVAQDFTTHFTDYLKNKKLSEIKIES
ncbi:MAG TPA: Rrf2 family transcriptional regulator [Spirochaetota bacterium]|nr:Rrf2 family transcriptional regulator [Spirochaetota bacterium]HPK04667.1 Rrf2 family transcriptional regulator [Bacteroidales bacterium]